MRYNGISFLGLVTAGLATLASAEPWTKPKGQPKGNPITEPSQGEIVPKGKPFEITWQPTTKGTVTLLLLHGPPSNVKPLYAIAQKIPNSGKYTWTPKSNLHPQKTGYAIQLIVDKTGQFQYSTQFGIGGAGKSSRSSSHSSSSGSTENESGSSSSNSGGYEHHESHEYSSPQPYGGGEGGSECTSTTTTTVPCQECGGATPYHPPTTYPVAPSYPAGNSSSSYPQPTGPPPRVSTSIYPAPTQSGYPPPHKPTGAANAVSRNLGFAGVVGGLVAILGL